MKMRVQVIIESAGDEPEIVAEVACIERGALQPETLGLTLAEAKEMLAGVQKALVPQQIAEYTAHQRCCPDCGRTRATKGHHAIVIRSLFGRLPVASPRFYACPCQPHTTASVSPVAALLPERTTPELRYLTVKAAALASYERAVDWLAEVLPIGGQLSTTALRRHVTAVAERLDGELCDGEPTIPGCPADWERLPDPDGPLTVGLDGGYVPARRGECRQATAFEAIIGKSITAEGAATCFGFVQSDDAKPRQRLVAVLQAQGMQMNQQITFLSDGGDNVRDLPLYLNPLAEHILDWFHITMRLTTMGQMAKGVRSRDDPALATTLHETLERLKWYLWHGNVFRALQLTDDLADDLEIMEGSAEARKLLKAVREFDTYIRVNRAFIPNYGERYRYGETISTAFVESTVNQVMSKRMAKRQQMRWTRRGAHRLLQVRTQVLDGALRGVFRRWYPAMASEDRDVQQAA